MTRVVRSGAVAFAFAVLGCLGVFAGASPAAADEITGGCTALVNGQDGSLITRDDPLVVHEGAQVEITGNIPAEFAPTNPTSTTTVKVVGDRRSDRRDERRAGERRSDLLGGRRERRRLLRRRCRSVSHRGHEPRRRMGLRVQRVPATRGGHALGPDRSDRARRDHRRRDRRVPHEGSQAEGAGLDRRRSRAPPIRSNARKRGKPPGATIPTRSRSRNAPRTASRPRARWRPTSG